MKLYMSDLYRIEVKYPLDEVQLDTLYFLYQPLLGSQGIQLYMMLYTEGKRMSRFLKPAPLSRLTSFLSMSLIEIEESLKKLEGIGLLNTYLKHENQSTQYIYKINAPLSLNAFFKNQILSTLLQESMSLEDFKKTVRYFQTSYEDIKGYEDITASFKDVFDITNQRGKKLKLQNRFKDKQTKDVEVKYDLDLLKKELGSYQVSKSLLKDDDYQYLIQLALVYSIDPLTLAGLIKDAVSLKGLDRKKIKQDIKKYYELDSASSLKQIHHKQPIQYLSDQKQDPLSLHMHYLDTITPYDLLKEKQGGSEPVFNDLMLVETLMVQLALKPAVVNVIIEYVLGKSNNRLSKRYAEAIGASMARKHIDTAMDAYNELMEIEEPEIKLEQTIEEVPEEQMSHHELDALLSDLKEGQL